MSAGATKIRESPSIAGTSAQLRCVSCTSPCRTSMGRPVSRTAEPGVNPSANASWRVSLPSYARSITIDKFSRCGPRRLSRCVLQARRGLVRRRGRTSEPFEHLRQPYESWWSILPGTCRWTAVRDFFNAPVPSGCTLTIVLSTETASILMRTICSR